MDYFKKFDKKCLLLHGLGSEPNSNRQRMLEKKGLSVIQEQHEYKTEWAIDRGESFFKRQLEIAKKCDVLIGISFGGYIAYHLSKALGKPAILINPAIDRSKSKTEIRDYVMEYNINPSTYELFCGENDKSVPMEYAIEWMNEHKEDYRLEIIKGLEHRVPDEYFIEILNKSKILK
jgi:predicted esterase YcpF (UPF0227 family)